MEISRRVGVLEHRPEAVSVEVDALEVGHAVDPHRQGHDLDAVPLGQRGVELGAGVAADPDHLDRPARKRVAMIALLAAAAAGCPMVGRPPQAFGSWRRHHSRLAATHVTDAAIVAGNARSRHGRPRPQWRCPGRSAGRRAASPRTAPRSSPRPFRRGTGGSPGSSARRSQRPPRRAGRRRRPVADRPGTPPPLWRCPRPSPRTPSADRGALPRSPHRDSRSRRPGGRSARRSPTERPAWPMGRGQPRTRRSRRQRVPATQGEGRRRWPAPGCGDAWRASLPWRHGLRTPPSVVGPDPVAAAPWVGNHAQDAAIPMSEARRHRSRL